MAGAADMLRHVPLFEDLDPDELQVLAGSLQERSFRAGETVIAQGDGGDGFFVVESGEAEAVVQGQPQGAIGPGDYFGEIALLMGSDRTATVRATSDLRCHWLAPSEFRAVVEGKPSIAWKLLQSMMERLS